MRHFRRALLFITAPRSPQVHWMQQQHEKVRKKRDYTTLGSAYSNQRASLLRNVAPESRIEYRDTGAHNFFPDPLFKEQWYLVSKRGEGGDQSVIIIVTRKLSFPLH